MNTWQRAAYQYMQDNIEDNRDSTTGEVNMTKLAEDCIWVEIGNDMKWFVEEDNAFEIAFAVVEQDAGRMTEVEAKKWIEDYGGD